MSFGEELKRLRESKGMTVNQLAIYSGVSAASISRYETGERGIPKPPTIEKLAKGLRVEYSELMKTAGYMDASKENTIERPYDGILREIVDRYPGVDLNDPDIKRKLMKAIDLVLDDYEKRK